MAASLALAGGREMMGALKLQEIPLAAVETRVLIAAPDERSPIFSTRTSYVARTGAALIQDYVILDASDTFGTYYQRRSPDNGKTWSEPMLIFSPQKTGMGTERRGEGAFLFDERSGRILRFYNRHIYPDEKYTVNVLKRTAIYYEVSEDSGTTFGPAQQLIVAGGTSSRWAPRVTYGSNSMMMAFSSPFVDRRGRILLPAQLFMFDETGRLMPMEAGCFIGIWLDRDRISWEIGDTVAMDAARSSRGMFEPAITELVDGKFLMICRGSNAGLPEAPGRKWLSVSNDGARGWSPPIPWRFDTNEEFYSPSSGSRLIRHSRSGKLYWIGNLSSENPSGNLPRHPLVIAEVDEKALVLKRATLRVIDQKRPADSERVQLSNFRVYEDRETGEFVLTLARLSEADGWKSPAYQHRFYPSSAEK